MHVFFLWDGNPDYIGEWIYPHFISELRSAGHVVTVFNPREHLGPGHDKERLHDVMLMALRAAQGVDLFLSFAFDELIAAETIDAVRKSGVPAVNFSCDNIEVPFRMREIASHFDAYWLPEPEAIPLFRDRLGARVFYAPMAANPGVFKPRLALEESLDASFCGNRYGSREYYIPELIRRGIDLRVYGKGWSGSQAVQTPAGHLLRDIRAGGSFVLESLRHEYGRLGLWASLKRSLMPPQADEALLRAVAARAGGVVSFEKMIDLYSESRVTLGFSERGNTYLLAQPLLQIRLRDFEATMSGACYLMRRIPEMLEYFEEDKEIVFYDSLEELVDKIRFWTAERNATARAQLRQSARRRAEAEHSWSKRFEKLCTTLGLPGMQQRTH